MNLHSSNESNGDSNGGGGGKVIATTTITTDEHQQEAASSSSSSSNKMNRNELAKYEIRMFVLFMIRLVFFITRACSKINRYTNKRISTYAGFVFCRSTSRFFRGTR